MNTKKTFNRNQLMALGLAILLSPALRLFPAGPARLAGRVGWLSAAAAAPALLLYIWFFTRFMGGRRENEGLAQVSLRLLGPRLGPPALLLTAAWLLLYAGFVLRSGADRFVTTIFPQGGPGPFTVTMGFLGLAGALCCARSLARVAKIILPVLLGVLLLVLGFSLFAVKANNLLPITYHDLAPLAIGALPVIDVVSLVPYLLGFTLGMVPREDRALRDWSLWMLLVCGLLGLISVAVIGTFGPELTARLTRPFFSLVRNLVFFNSLERIEALVVTLWVFPDFLLVSLLLWSAQLCLRLAFGLNTDDSAAKVLDPGRGRWLIWLCAGAAIAVGLLIAPTPDSLHLWSDRIVPLVNLGYAFLFLPLIYLTGKLRKAV